MAQGRCGEPHRHTNEGKERRTGLPGCRLVQSGSPSKSLTGQPEGEGRGEEGWPWPLTPQVIKKWGVQHRQDIYLDKSKFPSGLLDYREEPLLLTNVKKKKQANIQGIHCIIKTTRGSRRRGLSEFFFVSLILFFRSCLFWSFVLLPVSVCVCQTSEHSRNTVELA